MLGPGEELLCTFVNTQPPGSITIVKDAAPDSGTDFGFTDNITNCNIGTLDDDGAGGSATPNQATCTVAPNTYTVSENTLPAGWALTSIVCSDGSPVNLGNRSASIGVGPGENVTCTFTNTQNGTVIVDKVTNPPGHPESFGFTSNLPGNATFSLTDLSPPKSVSVAPGTYTVTEDAALPAIWMFTGVECVDSKGNDSTESDRTGTAVVEAGETVTCTFNNAKKGTVIIDKVTNPSGDSQQFGFTGDLPGNGTFSLADSTTPLSVTVAPGTYSVSEDANPAGWSLSDIDCDDSDSTDSDRTATVVVGPLETVKCTFTNTKNGTLVIDKVTNPAGEQQLFGFTGTDLPGRRTTPSRSPTGRRPSRSRCPRARTTCPRTPTRPAGA